MSTKMSQSTFKLDNCPSIVSYSAVVGKKEGQGPLSQYFDLIHDDTTLGEASWEKAESRLQKDSVNKALEKVSAQALDLEK